MQILDFDFISYCEESEIQCYNKNFVYLTLTQLAHLSRTENNYRICDTSSFSLFTPIYWSLRNTKLTQTPENWIKNLPSIRHKFSLVTIPHSCSIFLSPHKLTYIKLKNRKHTHTERFVGLSMLSMRVREREHIKQQAWMKNWCAAPFFAAKLIMCAVECGIDWRERIKLTWMNEKKDDE